MQKMINALLSAEKTSKTNGTAWTGTIEATRRELENAINMAEMVLRDFYLNIEEE